MLRRLRWGRFAFEYSICTRGRIVRFRNPDEKKMNALRLVPVFLLVVATFFTGHQTYLYLSGGEADTFLIFLGAAVMIYASVRSIFAMRRVFIWEHEEGGEDRENEPLRERDTENEISSDRRQ